MPNSLEQWLERLEERHPVTIDLGLDRCGTVYKRLGSPRPARQVITVAGTNGKGSTVAWIIGALGGLGLRTGAFTSPHLLHFNERLTLCGEPISDAALIRAFAAIEAARGEVSLTYFEFTTLACLLLMAEQALDVAVLEVGLGGRLDTVNLIDADVAVITTIGLDHQEWLGDTRELIALEKAGVMRTGRPVVISDPEPPASLAARAEELGAPRLQLGVDFSGAMSPEGEFTFESAQAQFTFKDLPLLGAHQGNNLAGALAAVFALVSPALTDPQTLYEALQSGLSSVALPGRLQEAGPAGQFLLDVGHNPLAAEAVTARLRSANLAPVICVLGMLADKDALATAQALAPAVAQFICASLPGMRGRSSQALAEALDAGRIGAPIITAGSVAEGLAVAKKHATRGQKILVFGSFLTVAEAAQALA